MSALAKYIQMINPNGLHRPCQKLGNNIRRGSDKTCPPNHPIWTAARGAAADTAVSAGCHGGNNFRRSCGLRFMVAQASHRASLEGFKALHFAGMAQTSQSESGHAGQGRRPGELPPEAQQPSLKPSQAVHLGRSARQPARHQQSMAAQAAVHSLPRAPACRPLADAVQDSQRCAPAGEGRTAHERPDTHKDTGGCCP